MSKYGRFISATGEIPAGSDGATLFRCFGGTDKQIEINFVQFYGGDSAEWLQLVLVPTAVFTTGLQPSDTAGTIAITPPEYMAGAAWTQDKPGALGSDNGGRGSPRFAKFTIPPWYDICIMTDTTNAAAWSCTVAGFELA